MARYLLTQYPNNKSAHQRKGKKRDKRKGNDSKSEDKDNNMGGTTGAHVEDTTTTEESTAPNKRASIGAHFLKKNQESSRPSRIVDEILGTHSMDGDEFLGNTNLGDMSIYTTNNKEMMTGSHITQQLTCKYQGPNRPELLGAVSKEPKTHDLSHNFQFDSSNKSKYLNILSNMISTNEITNNAMNTTDNEVLNQENQYYNNQHDQQLMTRKHDSDQGHHNQSNPQFIGKHNGGLEQVNTELVPNTVLEEKEEKFHKWANNYGVWDNNPYTPTKDN